MRLVTGLVSVALILLVLLDAFESVLLPRRVTHSYRLIQLFYRVNWRLWHRIACRFKSPRNRETFLSVFGPSSLLALFGTWAGVLVVAFGLLHWSLQTRYAAVDGARDLFTYVYFSGVTFFTLGYGDVAPADTAGRVLAVLEAGLGFGFLAVIISYHPVLAQAFSKRETTISLLDARGGSPPTAGQILIRARQSDRPDMLNGFLAEWEVWCAELLESCLSFPVLAYYRSQHDNQSWLAALTAILDTSALAVCGLSVADRFQSRVTFAIARHAAVDLCLVFKIEPVAIDGDRMSHESLRVLVTQLEAEGMRFPEGAATEEKLAELRAMYEPFLNGLSRHFLFPLPGFVPEKLTADNWQTSAWLPRTPGIRDLPGLERGDHFT